MHIKKTVFITYPRSGHHMLMRLLKNYFGNKMKYCEVYEHCKQFPCVDSHTNIMKNHDFDLSLPFRDDIEYFIQIRHPYYSIQSWYELHSNEYGQDTKWESFFKEKLNFWDKFTDKWLINTERYTNRAINYNNLIDRPFQTLSHIINIITNNILDADKLQLLIDNQGKLTKMRYLSLFKYFKIDDIKYIEETFHDKFITLGIRAIYNDILKEIEELKNNEFVNIMKKREALTVEGFKYQLNQKDKQIDKLQTELKKLVTKE